MKGFEFVESEGESTHQKIQFLILSIHPLTFTTAEPPPGPMGFWNDSLLARNFFLELVYLLCIEGRTKLLIAEKS